jgi:hypothetical protein
MKKKSNVMLPDVELEQADDHLNIRLVGFNMKLSSDERFVLGAILIVIFGFFAILVQPLKNISSADILSAAAISGILGLIVIAFFVMRAVKMTAIRVTQDAIEVNIDNEQWLTVRDVQKIYVEFKGVHKTLPQFRIIAVNEDGNQWILVSHLTQERADYIANVIQNYLRLEEAA